MPNKFKYNKTGTEIDSLFKGNWAIDTTAPNSGGGPSATTGLYHGATIPSGGYTIYSPGSVYTATTDDEILGKVRDLGGDWSSVSAALTWAASEPGVIILNKAFDNIVTDGLVLNLDASNISSFTDSQPTTNIHSPDAYGHNSGSYGNVVTVVDASSEKGAGWKKVTINNRGSNFRIIQWSYTGMSANIKYWHSVEFDWGNMRGKGYFINFDGNGTGARVYYHGNDFTTQGSNSITNIPDGRFSGSIIHTDSHNHAFFINNYSTGVAGINDYFYYKEFQVETTEYPTAYTGGTRLQNTGLYDLSNSDNHGVLINGALFDSNNYITFDGIDDRISIPNPLSHQSNLNQEWTVMACINVGAKTFQKLVGGLNIGVYAVYSANRTLLYLNGGVNDYYTYGGDLSELGWVMATFRFRNSDGYRTIWKNGTSITTSGPNYTSTPSGMQTTLYIGDGMDGSLSNILIYDRVISDAEVLQNYYQAPIVTDGLVLAVDAGNLVSYESGSATTYSMTGSDTGTLTNGVGFDSANGGGWVFDGVDDYVTFGNPSSMSNAQVTVTFWYNPTTLMNSTHNGIMNGRTPGGRFCLFWINGTTLSIQYRDDSGLSAAQGGVWTRSNAPVAVSANKWYFIQITGNESTNEWRVGVDLNVSTTDFGSQYVDPDSNQWLLGRRAGTAYDHSKIANLQIYDRILSQGEIEQNYNAQRNRFGI